MRSKEERVQLALASLTQKGGRANVRDVAFHARVTPTQAGKILRKLGGRRLEGRDAVWTKGDAAA